MGFPELKENIKTSVPDLKGPGELKVILTNSRKHILQRCVLNCYLDLSRAQRAIETEQISNEAGNVWGGHGGSRKDVGRSVIESRDYVKTRSPDVDARTKIGE